LTGRRLVLVGLIGLEILNRRHTDFPWLHPADAGWSTRPTSAL